MWWKPVPTLWFLDISWQSGTSALPGLSKPTETQWIISIYILEGLPVTQFVSFSPCKHVHAFVCFSLFGSCRWLPAGLPKNKQKKPKRFTGVTNQPITARQDSVFVTLITSSFPLCSLYVRVSVYRVFPHLESELCFPLGPFPCSENSFPPPCLSRLPSSSLSLCFL